MKLDLPKGFTAISGKRSPPRGERKYEVQFRNGFIDSTGYTAKQLVWVHDGGSWDVVAVRAIGDESRGGVAWNPKSGGY